MAQTIFVYLSKMGGAFLPELSDRLVPSVLLVAVTLIHCVCFLLPTGLDFSSQTCYAYYYRRTVMAALAEDVLWDV